jgi:hypothetical protein
MSKQRMSVRLNLNVLATRSSNSLAAPKYPTISERSWAMRSVRDHCLDT